MSSESSSALSTTVTLALGTLKHVKTFSKHIIIQVESTQDTDLAQWADIYRIYTSLKQISWCINQILGLFITCYLTAGILEYALGLDEVFIEKGDRDWTSSICIMFFFLDRCVVICLAADITRIMQKFKVWLAEKHNRLDIKSDQLYLIINELDKNVVAIKGSNVFPISYALAADVRREHLTTFSSAGCVIKFGMFHFYQQMAGMTVTYFIICVQF